MHASADTHDPLASHLELVPDSLGDGFFHAAEIAAARTHGSLVVLSACETTSGPIYGGEGATGIARAFLAGGAQAVVAAQWPVGAETAALMRDFYHAARARRSAPRGAARGQADGAALRGWRAPGPLGEVRVGTLTQRPLDIR